MKYPPVVIVNDQDQVIGEAPLAEARERGLIYRVVFVIVEDSHGRILLQKRDPAMQLFPGCWDISASGHVDDGNSYEEAAQAELWEELGLPRQELTPVAHFYTETPALNGTYPPRYARIFRTQLNESPKHLGAGEVTEVCWFTRREIERLIKNQPGLAAEGIQHAYRYVLSRERAAEPVA